MCLAREKLKISSYFKISKFVEYKFNLEAVDYRCEQDGSLDYCDKVGLNYVITNSISFTWRPMHSVRGTLCEPFI